MNASQAGVLNAWIDFNIDGDWSDANEQIFINRSVVAGSNEFSLPVPDDAVTGETWSRFRLSSQTGLAPTGEAVDGEVEDYSVTIGLNPWTNPDLAEDVDASGMVTPVDALIVINELNEPVVRDVTTGRLPMDVIPDGMAPNFFFDVNGDGFVSPIDALLVINTLSSTSASAMLMNPPAGRVESSAQASSLLFDAAEREQVVQASNGLDDENDSAITSNEAYWNEYEPASLRTDAVADEAFVLDGVLDGSDVDDSVLNDLADDVASAWRNLG